MARIGTADTINATAEKSWFCPLLYIFGENKTKKEMSL